MASPTEVVTEQLYPLNAYGSAMAPLFMNLTFWIGAFMLLVIMRQEVDGEGIESLTLGQRYWGRFLLLAAMRAAAGRPGTHPGRRRWRRAPPRRRRPPAAWCRTGPRRRNPWSR